MKTLSERLRQAMNESSGITQVEIARYCGISPASITKWVDGRTKRLDGSNLIRAAQLLGVTPLWLAEGRGPMRPKGGEASTATAETVDLRQWLSTDELALIETYGKLSPAKQKVLMRFVRTFVTPGVDDNSDVSPE